MAQGEQPEAGWRSFLALANATGGLQPAPISEIVAPMPFSTGPALRPSYDVVDALPPAAAEKLRLLRQRSDDQHAIIPEFEIIRQANLAKIEAANALSRLTNSPQDFGFNLPETDARVVAAKKHLDKMTDDARRLTELQQIRTATWHQSSQAKAACEDWLKHGRPSGVVLQDHETEMPQLKKGEAGLLDAIEARRRRVRELRADLYRIRSAPYPSSYAKQQMREQIEALAMQGEPSVSLLIEHDGKIVWPMQMTRSEVRGGEHPALAFAETLDAVALTCWLHKSALIAALDREISTESDDAASLSHEARQKAEAEVMGDLLDIERQEAVLVFAAWEQRLACEHRADISPVALLGLQLISAPRAAPPNTSAEHVRDIAGVRR